MRLDAHQHFWNYNQEEFDWIDDNMQVIRKSFIPGDLSPVLQQNQIDGCIAVQARQSEEETDFLLQLAAEHEFIKGVVGWVDLRSPRAEDRLAHYASFSKLKGFRHVVQGEPQVDFMLREDFQRGISFLKKYNFTYDILIFPKHLLYAVELAKKFPDQPFVLDHIAKPDIKSGKVQEEWVQGIRELGQLENVSCKISGMVTEADWQGWKKEEFLNHTDVVVESFGPKRLMFGSDWPVCLVAAPYEEVVAIAAQAVQQFSDSEKEQFWGGNCARFYSVALAVNA